MSRPPITVAPVLLRTRVRALIATALAAIYLIVHLVAGEISWFAVGLAVVVDGTFLTLWARGRRAAPPMPDALPAGSRIQSAWAGVIDTAAYPLFVGFLPVLSRSLSTEGIVHDPSPWGGVPLFAAAFFAVIAFIGWDRARSLHRTEIAAGRRLYSNGASWRSSALYVEVAAPAPASTPASRRVVAPR